jgi:Sulfotransferase domain
MTLPNFLIIGASKSGTTTLHNIFLQHPEIFICPTKEVGFFWAYEEDIKMEGPGVDRLRHVLITDLGQYERLFAKATSAKAIGEASVRYISHPNVPERIHRIIPRVRLIANLRQPADRAFSAFTMNRRDGLEPCSDFREALKQERSGLRDRWISCRYLNRGFYYDSLKRYLEYFDRGQMHISLMDDLISDPQGLLKNLFKFLEVDESFSPDLSKRYNPSGIIRNPIRRIIWTHSNRIRAAIRPIISARMRRLSTQWFIRDVEKPAFDPDMRAALTEYYRQDIEHLQELLDRDLHCWLKDADS